MELVGSGAQADIYKDNDRAIKLFKYNISKEEVENEFNFQRMAFNYGLSVPQVFEIIEKDQKYGFEMEYIDGMTLGSIILKNIWNTKKYIIKSIEIQNQIHKIETDNFPNMKDKLRNYILCANELSDLEKQKLLNKLESMIFVNKLCHGDFHIFNLIQTTNNIKIIDWICASSGNPEADICRTYLLYKLSSKILANMYLSTYCKIMNVNKNSILEWEPIIAGARLGEYTKNDKEKNILKKIIRKSMKSVI